MAYGYAPRLSTAGTTGLLSGRIRLPLQSQKFAVTGHAVLSPDGTSDSDPGHYLHRHHPEKPDAAEVVELSGYPLPLSTTIYRFVLAHQLS